MKSVKSLGILSIVVLVASAISALVGLLGLAICLVAGGMVLGVALLRVAEQRRHAAHRQVIQSIALLRSQIEADNQALLKQHKLHTNSMGLLFRELRALSSELTGGESVLESHSERQLATYLHALRITKREVLEAAGASREVGTQRKVD